MNSGMDRQLSHVLKHQDLGLVGDSGLVRAQILGLVIALMA